MQTESNTFFNSRFARQEPDPFRSEWRLEQERRRAEEALKAPRYAYAPQIVARQERIASTMPRKKCEGCNKDMRAGTKSAKCHNCTRDREKCECGKTIYAGNTTGKCMACFKRKKCAVADCDKLLNANNEYGVCKPHYQRMRRSIHQHPMVKCADPGCQSMVRPSNLFGKCRIHSRRFYAARAKANMKAKTVELARAA
jgi:hypothetical protein